MTMQQVEIYDIYDVRTVGTVAWSCGVTGYFAHHTQHPHTTALRLL